MSNWHIHLIPGQKLCPSCRVSIQEINGKRDCEENDDERNRYGDNDGINESEEIFVLFEQRTITTPFKQYLARDGH